MPVVLAFFFAYLLSLIKHCLLTLFHVTQQLIFSYAIFEKLALNSLVIPDDILEPEERKLFPYPSLELLLQDKVCEENL